MRLKIEVYFTITHKTTGMSFQSNGTIDSLACLWIVLKDQGMIYMAAPRGIVTNSVIGAMLGWYKVLRHVATFA